MILRSLPKRVLEVGCGIASHSILLSKLLPKTNFVCIDNNKEVLKIAKRNYKKFNGKRIIFINVDAKRISKLFNENYFDIAISQGLLEHFNDSEILKILTE